MRVELWAVGLAGSVLWLVLPALPLGSSTPASLSRAVEVELPAAPAPGAPAAAQPPVPGSALVARAAPASSAPPVVPALPRASFGKLPGWVQTKQDTPLWSGPTEPGVVQFNTLPAWTFLRVAGAQRDRLLVAYAGDDTTRQPGTGWVSAMAVQPSDPGGTWLRNYRATRLAPAPGSSGPASVGVPQWSPMRLLAQEGERIQARVYAPDFSRVLAEGWLPSADVGPVGAPEQPVATDPPVRAPATPFRTRESFIAAVAEAASQSRATSGVPASVTIAQAILESDWGTSLLSRVANNYFGIKAMGEMGNDGAVWMKTLEYDAGGAPYYTVDPFRAYRSLADSIADHDQLFRRLPRYRPAMEAASDPAEFARRIAAGGYSSDPAYPDKLVALMDRYDLYRFDR